MDHLLVQKWAAMLVRVLVLQFFPVKIENFPKKQAKMGEHGVSSLIFFFFKKKHEKSIILPIVFIVLFLNFLKFLFLFLRFSKRKRRKNVGSFDYFVLPQSQHITKNRKNQHLFRCFRFEKVEKEPKIFQKIQKRTTKKSEEPWIFRVLFFKKKKKKRRNSRILF